MIECSEIVDIMVVSEFYGKKHIFIQNLRTTKFHFKEMKISITYLIVTTIFLSKWIHKK